MPSPMDDDRLNEKLREHLRFLERSASIYDSGGEDEALRMAVSLRVLFHHTDHSMSLMAQLGLQKSSVLSSSKGHGNWKDYLGVELSPQTSPPVKARPLLGVGFHRVPMNDWWASEPVFTHADVGHPRRRIVLSAANKDGGAHVDPSLERYYEELCRGEYLVGITGNMTFTGPAPYPQGVTIYPSNGHLALLRQFAHEVLSTASHLKWGSTS